MLYAGTQVAMSAFSFQWWMNVMGLGLNSPINFPLNIFNVKGVDIFTHLPPTSCFSLPSTFLSVFLLIISSSFFGSSFYFLCCVFIWSFWWSPCSFYYFVFSFFLLSVCECVLSCVCGAVKEEDRSRKKKGRREMKRKSNMSSNWKGWVSCSSTLQTNNGSRGLLPSLWALDYNKGLLPSFFLLLSVFFSLFFCYFFCYFFFPAISNFSDFFFFSFCPIF